MRAAAWCDGSAPFATRAAALVANLTLDEKAGLFVNQQAAVPRVDLPAYNWWSEALHGVARDGVATSFPQIIGVAASLNRSLWSAIGAQGDVDGGAWPEQQPLVRRAAQRAGDVVAER